LLSCVIIVVIALLQSKLQICYHNLTYSSLAVLGDSIIVIILFRQRTKYKMTPPNHTFVAELDCCTDDVIVTLKEYDEINNQTNNVDNDLLCKGDIQHDVDISQSTANPSIENLVQPTN